MTVAVCLRCGAKKRGALTSCHGCGFVPIDNRDKAEAMILTDHCLSSDQVDAIAERIRARLPVTFPEDAVAEYVALLERGADKSPALPVLGLAMLLLFVLIAVAYFLFRGA
jgi:hypothetical protein